MRGNRIRRLLRRLDLYTGSISKVHFYGERNELPDLPKVNEIAVAGTATKPKWALFDCPCGHGHTILLPLSEGVNPHWQLTNDRRGPSIYPSVDRQGDRRCHYWIKSGKIQWV